MNIRAEFVLFTRFFCAAVAKDRLCDTHAVTGQTGHIWMNAPGVVVSETEMRVLVRRGVIHSSHVGQLPKLLVVSQYTVCSLRVTIVAVGSPSCRKRTLSQAKYSSIYANVMRCLLRNLDE